MRKSSIRTFGRPVLLVRSCSLPENRGNGPKMCGMDFAVEWLEHDVGDAVTPGGLEVVADLALPPGVSERRFSASAGRLEQAADTVREDGGRRVEPGARRRFDPTQAQRPVGTLDVDVVEGEQVEVHVDVERAAEALDRRHHARLRALG